MFFNINQIFFLFFNPLSWLQSVTQCVFAVEKLAPAPSHWRSREPASRDTRAEPCTHSRRQLSAFTCPPTPRPSPDKQWQLLEEAAGLALSYTAPTYRVMFSIDSPPWIIHSRNLKFPCKVVLRSSVCLCVSLARHPGGERKLPWTPSISDPAAHADVTPL